MGLLLISGTAFMVRAQTLPAVKTVRFETSLTSPVGGGLFIYTYTVTNPASNSGSIWRIDIDISKPSGGLELSSQGLLNGPGFLQITSSAALRDPASLPVVPVGLNAPPNWVVGLSTDGTAGWGPFSEEFLMQPGQSVSGYQITSRGLPAIRAFVVGPHLDVNTLPIKPPDDDTDLKRYESDLDTLEASVSVKGVTVAPTAPPADFKPLAFLQTIQSYKDQALKQGWITGFGIANSLDVKLNSAQRALERQDNTTAKNVLSALLHEVDAQGGKHLSPEAVALLKFNTEFLITKIL